MRISDTKVCQFIESDPPTIVIVDESTGEEIDLNRAEAAMVMIAIDGFMRHMNTPR